MFAECQRLGLTAWWLLLGAPSHALAAEWLPPSVVLGERRMDPSVTAEWSREEIIQSSRRSIDEVLAQEPGFSLYRRQSVIFANPTSAGVSLNHTGATAASRSLVLLDGIPQNDPFGGWVNWARYDALTLDSARIVSSAQALPWGNQAPAGVIQLNGASPFDERHCFRLAGGSHGSMGASTSHSMSNEERTRAVSFAAFGFHTDGYYALDASQRGEVDRRLGTDFFGEEIKLAWLLAPGVTLEPKFSHYDEHRNNGTELSENSTEALDFSLRLNSQDAAVSWQATLWHQRRDFQSVFTSVTDDRSSESVALDQFDVPGLGAGAAWSAAWGDEENWSFQMGMDFKWLTGETNEDVGTFRRREAGGQQSFVGVFFGTAWQASEADRFQINARADRWEMHDGRRIETSLVNGALLREDHYRDRDEVEPSASLEWMESRVALGSGFRLPSLNELYRPYRVRGDSVEANPDLDPERFMTMEAGLDWRVSDQWKLGASGFHHWISDAIANVPVTDSESMRDNVDEARVAGIKVDTEWLPHESLTLAMRGLWSETEFYSSPDQPLLEGKPFPQAPDLRVIADAEWRVFDDLNVFGGVEYGASQFDDALAKRVIPDYTSVKIGVMRKIGNAVWQVCIENLFDEEIVTGVSSDGLRTLSEPRSLWTSIEWGF
jgi:outer membrane cobalamin receptor